MANYDQNRNRRRSPQRPAPGGRSSTRRRPPNSTWSDLRYRDDYPYPDVGKSARDRRRRFSGGVVFVVAFLMLSVGACVGIWAAAYFNVDINQYLPSPLSALQASTPSPAAKLADEEGNASEDGFVKDEPTSGAENLQKYWPELMALTEEEGDGEVVEAATMEPEPEATPEPTSTPTSTPEQVYVIYQRGDNDQQVKLIQEKLVELGYLDGGADGSFGPKTEEAVKSFQESSGLIGSGVADEATQAVLFTTAAIEDELPEAQLSEFGLQEEGLPVAANPADETVGETLMTEDSEGEEATAQAHEQVEVTYKKGDVGEQVKLIQEKLVELGFLSGAADGAFGPMTEVAVMAYQKSVGMEESGVVDGATWETLFAPEVSAEDELPTEAEVSVEASTEVSAEGELLAEDGLPVAEESEVPKDSTISLSLGEQSVLPDYIAVRLDRYDFSYEVTPSREDENVIPGFFEAEEVGMTLLYLEGEIENQSDININAESFGFSVYTTEEEYEGFAAFEVEDGADLKRNADLEPGQTTRLLLIIEVPTELTEAEQAIVALVTAKKTVYQITLR